MKPEFKGDALPVLIGSIPVEDHDEALRLVTRYTPEIPLWAQLPAFRQEGMMLQFLPGMPGFTDTGERFFIDMASETFEQEMLEFYEAYLTITETGEGLENSRFALDRDWAAGFFKLLEHLEGGTDTLSAVKGQITGPLTFGTGVTDKEGKAIFYDDQLRDMAVKLIALKATWQVKQFSRFNLPTIIFFDEPALSAFGSSAFISISRDDLAGAFDEVIAAVHGEGGLAGIHVCANADWSLLLDSALDIISFDAYSYFDNFILYADSLKRFLARGGILAWGIVPTLNADDVEKETTASITEKLEEQISRVVELGVERETLIRQSLISPSCGTGALSLPLAKKVLAMTAEVSEKIRSSK